MLPIFSWDYDPLHDTDYRHQIRAENETARVRLKQEILIVDVAEMPRGTDTFGYLMNSVPGHGPFVMAPRLSLQRTLTDEILQLLLEPEKPIVTEWSTTFLVDVYAGKLMVRLSPEGDVEIAGLHVGSRLGFAPGVLAIEDFNLHSATVVPFDQPPVPLTGTIEELRRGFWKKINVRLRDPWLGPRTRRMTPKKLRSVRGSINSLNATARTLISTWMALNGHEDKTIRALFHSAGGDGNAGGCVLVQGYEGLQPPAQMRSVLQQVFEDNRFVGSSVQMSIGSKSRQSGYLHTPVQMYVTVDFDGMSAHEILDLTTNGPKQCADWMRKHYFCKSDIETLYGKQDG